MANSTMAARTSMSFLSLNPNFTTAAQESKFSDKLTSPSASLVDVSLFLPEYILPVWNTVFLSIAPSLRITKIAASYLTPSNEKLSYSGWGIGAGVCVGGGYRLVLSEKLAIDLQGQIFTPMKNAGRSEIEHERDNSIVPAIFSEDDLSDILEALEPYMKSLTQQTTLGAGLRLVYRQ
ncbi:MAG: hypothetical protein ACO3A4_10140 [Silvanigrellaceae bacterium]